MQRAAATPPVPPRRPGSPPGAAVAIRLGLLLAVALAATAFVTGASALPTSCMDGASPQNCGTGWPVSIDAPADINVNTPVGERAAGEVLRLGVMTDATNVYFYVKVASNNAANPLPWNNPDGQPAPPVGAPPPGTTTPVANSVAYSIRMEIGPNACVGVAPRYVSPEGWINNNVYATACTAVGGGGGGPNPLATTPDWICNEALITLGWDEIGIPPPNPGTVYTNVRVNAQDSNVAAFTFDAGPTGGSFTVGENGNIWQSPPAITSVAAVGDNTVRVRWDAGDDNGSQPITRWNVYRKTTGPYVLLGSAPATQTYYDDTTALQGVAYTYRVSGVSCDELPTQPLALFPGETQFSAPASVVPDFRPLASPAVQVHSPTLDSLTIDWDVQGTDCPAPVPECPGSDVSATPSGVMEYEIWGGGPFSEDLLDVIPATTCGATCIYLDEGRESRITYCYFVITRDGHTPPNRSPATPRACGTTLGPGGPPAPDPIDTTGQTESDGDGVADGSDNCPGIANNSQLDIDADAIGDACDPDRDGDLVPDLEDICPTVSDPLQLDDDLNGVGDACQSMTAKDATLGFPVEGDGDGDGIADDTDNCPGTPNASQADADKDLAGDECDLDVDGDGILDHGPAGLITDNCLPSNLPLEKRKPGASANYDQKDTDGDGIGDACKAPAARPTCVNCTTAKPATDDTAGAVQRSSSSSVPVIVIIGIVVGAAIGGILAVVSLRRRRDQ